MLWRVQVAWLTGVSRVSLGFEKSADEGNGVFVRGGRLEVNHQYDKSSAFLRAAQQYVARSLAPQLQAASALSDLWELQVRRPCVAVAAPRAPVSPSVALSV